MKKTSRRLMYCVIGVLLIAALALILSRHEQNSSENTASRSETYHNAQYGFSLEYPETMKIQAPDAETEYPVSQVPIASIHVNDPQQTEAHLAIFTDGRTTNNLCSQTPSNASPSANALFKQWDENAPDILGIKRTYTSLHNGQCMVIEITSYPSACINSGCENRQWSTQTEQALLDRLDQVAQTFTFDK